VFPKMETKKERPSYICKSCNFTTMRKCNYEKHILTRKHKKEQEKEICEKCGKSYATRGGLWKHGQTCSSMNEWMEEQKEMSKKIVKQQAELKEMMEQMNQKPTIHISIFLNESCKDAMNWMDFINTLEFNDKPLQTIQEQLHKLGIYKRPVHYLPQQTFYLKHQDVWEHDTSIIKDVIRRTNHTLQERHLRLLQSWENDHPAWYTSQKETDIYIERCALTELTETTLTDFKLPL